MGRITTEHLCLDEKCKGELDILEGRYLECMRCHTVYELYKDGVRRVPSDEKPEQSEHPEYHERVFFNKAARDAFFDDGILYCSQSRIMSSRGDRKGSRGRIKMSGFGDSRHIPKKKETEEDEE